MVLAFISCKILSIIVKVYNCSKILFFVSNIFSKWFPSFLFRLFNILSYISLFVDKKNSNSNISFLFSNLLNNSNNVSINCLSFPKEYLGNLILSIYGISSGSFILCKSSRIPIVLRLSHTISSFLVTIAFM